jgi:hypothetical protein
VASEYQNLATCEQSIDALRRAVTGLPVGIFADFLSRF